MPILPTNEDEGQDFTKAITGAEWNDLIDYLQRATPRGDGDTTYAEVTRDGTRIKGIDVPVADGGGARLVDLPAKTNHPGHALVKGEEWNKLLNYVQMVTPIADEETATGEGFADGFQFSFPPLPVTTGCVPGGCTPGDFYLDVTITGGTYPFEWLGVTWCESGQTHAVCGSGSQGDSIVSTFYGTPIYTFAGYQNWIGSNTTTGTALLNVGGAGKNFVNPKIKMSKTATPSPFLFDLAVGGFTFVGQTVTSLNQSNLAAYTPTPNSLWSNATSSRLTPVMFGSVTLTSGRVISWAPVPALEWDYDNPPP